MLNNPEPSRYPLLESILATQDLPLQPMYTNKDVAGIFKTCVRAIQNWISTGRLVSRDLPGRARFLNQDLEDFLRNSKKGRR